MLDVTNKDLNNSYIIFSVYKSDANALTNETNHESVKLYLKTNDIGYKELEGNYKGFKEKSFIINSKFALHAIKLAQKTDQESILFLSEVDFKSGARPAIMIGISKVEYQEIGFFHSVENEPNSGVDYTYDPTTKKYYVVDNGF